MSPAQKDLFWASSGRSRSLHRASGGGGPRRDRALPSGSKDLSDPGKSLSLSEPKNQVSQGDKTRN